MQAQRLIEHLRGGTSRERQLADAVTKSHKFTFDAGKIPEHILKAASDFTSELLGAGILPVPFDDCLFEFGPGGIGNVCARFWVFVERYEIKESPGWEAYMYAAVQGRKSFFNEHTSWVTSPLVSTTPDIAKILTEPVNLGEPNGSFQVYGIWDKEKHQSYMQNYEKTPNVRQAVANSGLNVDEFYSNLSFRMFEPAFNYILSVLGLMATKSGVTTTNVLPSRPDIDAKRVKMGKLPLGYEHKVVTIDSSLLKMPGIVGAGGTHASPRMHWRRGHVRHYGTGRITSVRPAIVGDVSRGVIAHDYAVKAGRSSQSAVSLKFTPPPSAEPQPAAAPFATPALPP